MSTNTPSTMFDAAIIGGSFAGLSAAFPLARARRRIAVFDTGLRRNRFAAASHGLLGQEGRPPEQIVAEARAQLARYDTIAWIDSEVSEVAGNADAGFALKADGRTWRARRLVLATGVVDELPDIPGLRERWGRHVFHCPYCHGYELGRGRIGVIAIGSASLHQAQLLPEWGAVTLFTNGVLELGHAERRELVAWGVEVERTPIAVVEDEARVALVDGRRLDFAGLFTASRTRPASTLAAQLGCEHEEGPMGAFVKTGLMKDTSVPGVFACGDLARGAGNVPLAIGDGSLAGTAAHRSLVIGC